MDKKESEVERDYAKQVRADRLKQKIKLSIPAPEGLKKSWERENRVKEIRKKNAESRLAKLPDKRRIQAQRIRQYEQEYIEMQTEVHENIKRARLDGNFYKEGGPKIAIVIRIRGYVDNDNT